MELVNNVINKFQFFLALYRVRRTKKCVRKMMKLYERNEKLLQMARELIEEDTTE